MQLKLAPVGSGKTETALQTIAATLNENPFARVWVLIATRRQEDNFRQRLIEYNDGRSIYFNIEFFDFYDLYRRLLNIAGQPARSLHEGARYGILRTVIKSLKQQGQLSLYYDIAETPGFTRIVGNLIAELKQNRVYPDMFFNAAQTQKDRELALIYVTYQMWLQEYDLVDRDGEGWLALAVAERQEELMRDVALLVADGFDQFTPVQADLMALLSSRARNTLVTLTTVPQREDTIGRRFEEARQMLTSRREDADIGFIDGLLDRHADIQHVVETVFLDHAPRKTPEATPGVMFIEAPDPAVEVASVLRRVKRLLLDGCPPDDVLIALRDWTRYQPHFIALRQSYKLPLSLHYGESLAANPLINTLTMLISLHENDFRRRDLLDVLRSPYVLVPGLDKTQVDLLEKISQHFTVTRGRELWLNAIERAARRRIESDEDEVVEQGELISFEESEQLAAHLVQFFERVTPPKNDTLYNYIVWLEKLIGNDPHDVNDPDPDDEPLVNVAEYTLDMIAALRAVDDKGLIARDLAAVQELKRLMRNMLTTNDLISGLDSEASLPVEWAKFSLDLTGAINSGQINPRPNRGGRVLVTTATDARGLPHKHVFILGLSEGIFPSRVPEDPLYLDSERTRLTREGVLLRTQAERATDDGLFYELICLPRHSLTLSRPTSQDGQPWHASHLWRAVQSTFTETTVQRLRAGEVVKADEAAALHEAALCVADGFGQTDEKIGSLYNWLLRDQPEYWRLVHLGQGIEARRMSRKPHDHYSGRLREPHLIEQARKKLSPYRMWSATQFNDYGMCGFRFFAKRLLKLQTLEEPEEGMDVLKRGSLNHRILEMTYRRIQDAGMFITPQNSDTALDILRDVAAEELDIAPQTFGFRPTALWEKEKKSIVDRLSRLVERDFSPENPINAEFGGADRRPYRLEAPFGGANRDDSGTGGPDVWIEAGEAGRIRATGLIDRIDRVGDSLVVMDYKTGSTKFKVDDMRTGRNFQMIVYLLAAEQMLKQDQRPDAPTSIAGGVFWHTRNGEISGTLRWDDVPVFEEALNHLGHYLEMMREGDFAVQPTRASGGKCNSYCEFNQICRLCGLNLRKA